MRQFISRYVGDKRFYRAVITVALPIMLQMGITNFVNLLDNIMVGTLGTESISAVSIVNQFIFIFNLLIFGAASGAGIFTAQFHGARERDNVRYTFRFKLMISIVIGIVGTLIFSMFSDELINLFLHDAEDGANLEITFLEAKSYIGYIIIGLIPYTISQAYASTMRETGKTVLPMVSSMASVGVNFALNLVLIFGLLGAPELGVAGAAIATSVSRFVELFILVMWGHTHKGEYYFLDGAFRSMHVPSRLIAKISVKALPIITNEFFWSLAITTRNQCYSTRGLEALAASGVSQMLFNVFSVVYYSLGSTIAIMVGNRLGANDIEGAKDTSRKMIAFSVTASFVMGILLLFTTPYLPLLFNVEPEVRALASYMMRVNCLLMPVYAFANTSYYTIRSGGRVSVTMLMDSGFMWACVVPVSMTLAHLSDISIFYLYPICQATEIFKIVLAAVLLKKFNWARRMAG